MKYTIISLCLFLCISCKQKYAIPKEVVEQAIKEVVEGETLAYMAKDYEKWASYWDHGTDVLRLDVSNEGFSQTRGWTKSGGHLETFFIEHPEPITSTFVNSNYLIFHDVNLAWVAFDQTWTTSAGENSVAKATITLIKNEDSWKMKSYTAIQYEASATEINTLSRE